MLVLKVELLVEATSIIIIVTIMITFRFSYDQNKRPSFQNPCKLSQNICLLSYAFSVAWWFAQIPHRNNWNKSKGIK
jgi:hypothetical protein